DIAHHLGVRDAAGRAHASADVVRAVRSFAKIQMRRDRRVAVMSKLTNDLHDPFVPAGKVMNDDNAGIFPGGGRAGVIGFALIAVMAAKFHRLRLHAAIVTHDGTPFDETESDPGPNRSKLYCGQRYSTAL